VHNARPDWDYNLGVFEFKIDGVKVGDSFTCPVYSLGWITFTIDWVALTDETVTLSLIDTLSQGGGNDLTIDNIKFERIPAATVPEPATIWLFCTALAGIIGMRRKFEK